jgi:KaiC/GvpD/RAD55 family RecA-like ATPase
VPVLPDADEEFVMEEAVTFEEPVESKAPKEEVEPEEEDVDDVEEVVSIGIPKLDVMLLGGIPKGYMILVEGTPGSGMELFAKQFAGAKTEEEKALYVATNETAADVRRLLRQYRWSTDITIDSIAKRYYDAILVKEMFISKLRREGLTVKEIETLAVSKGKQFETKKIDFLAETEYKISTLEPPYRVVIDSVDFFLQQYPSENVLMMLRTVKAHTQRAKGLTLVTMVSGAHDVKTESGIRAIVDCIIELEVQKLASEFENRLIVRKLKNHPDKTAILTYAITEGGITPERVSRIT